MARNTPRRDRAARLSVGFLILLALAVTSSASVHAAPFVRGDVDANGRIELTDGIRVLGFLFLGSPPELSCSDAADTNDSGGLDLTDGVFVFTYLFLGGPAPPIPFPDCGDDASPDALGCEEFSLCPTSNAPATPRVDPPVSPTSEIEIDVTGSAAPGVQIEVFGGAVPILVANGNDGRFIAHVRILPDRVNRLFVRAKDSEGRESAPASIEIIHDLTAPEVSIDEPSSGTEVTSADVTVTGRVADLLSGFLGLEVTVNGEPANVVVGIGTNGSFERRGVALELGENTITAVATDAVGNRSETSVTVIRRVCSGSCIEAVSGNGQEAPVATFVSEPIAVRVTQADGSPFSGKIVDFHVVRSDGRVADSDNLGAELSMRFQARTDAQGIARAFWRLGNDAGCGNNRVLATSAGIDGRAIFCASASPGPAAQINVGSGNNQRAEVGGPAPKPLVAWVNDSCNGVAGVPVTFTVERGGGSIDGKSTATVVTSRTGHAIAPFQLGPQVGNQVVRADFEGNLGRPAVFVVYGLERREDGSASFHGVVLDNSEQPLGGAGCHLIFPTGESAAAVTADDGAFVMPSLSASGPARLFVDGLQATRIGGANGENVPPGSFPSLTFDTIIVPRAENSLSGPILLPRLDPANAVVYDGTADVELTVAGVEGLRMRVRAGSMRRADGSVPSPADPAILQLNQVLHDAVPMPMPDGAAPPFAWTLQPSGAHFDPPVEISYPNMSGLPAGAASYFLSFNHDTGRFEIVASGRVSDDGATITTDPGTGLRVAGWGCNCPPYSVTGDCDDDPCESSKDFMNQQCQSTAGSGSGALNCQLACLANNACNPDSPPWVQCTINDYADNRRRGNVGPADGLCRHIPSWVPTISVLGVTFNAGDLCFAVDGTAHLFNELVPTWTRKCNEVNDGEHNAFLFGTLVPCLLSNSHMSLPFRALGGLTVPLVANIAREIIQSNCGEGGGNGIDPAPPLPDPDEFFAPEIAEASQLAVEAADGSFYVRVGEPLALKVTRKSDGSDVTLGGTGTLYFAALAPRDNSEREAATITADGVLTVLESPSPLASIPVPFLVAVRNGDDLGLGQFAVIDDDSDGDLLADSYEVEAGLDPDVAALKSDDTDGDGVADLSEALLGTAPTIVDTDGDGVSDGAEVRQGSDPLDPSSTLPSFAPPTVHISISGGRAAEDCPPDSPPVVTVNGQTVTAEHDGSFRIGNIAAPDLFGPDGPGTRPDFLSDDPVRAVAVFTRNCRTYWAFSEPFQIEQGETFRLDQMTVTDRAPPLPAAIRIDAPTTLLEIGESVQLSVIATLGDGGLLDVTNRASWTIYRTSNPKVAMVGPDGLVAGQSPGVVYITAVNEAATAVKRFTVTAATIETTVEGLVELEDGSRVSGADVRTTFGNQTKTNAGGFFQFDVEAPSEASLSVIANATIAGETLTGVARDLAPVSGGVTDAGRIVLRPGLRGEWFSREPLPTARGALCAATLADGIHVIGGDFNWGGATPFTVHEVYDPATGEWSTRAPAPDNNLWGVVCGIAGGKIYLVGGWRSGGTLLREYDPQTDAWTYRAPIPGSFTWGHAAASTGTEIIAIGGTCGPCVRIYNVASDSWRSGVSIPINRSSLAAVALDGRVYVVGTGSELQIYDVALDEWSQGADLPVACNAPSAAAFAGKIYVFGGSSLDPTAGGDLRAVQEYDPILDAWTELEEMPTNRSWSAAAATDTSIHVFGGFDLQDLRIDTHEEMR